VGRARWIAFLLFAAGMGALSFLRWHTFHSRSLDMAYYVRIVWGIKEGEWGVPIVGAPHFLGLHLEPFLFLLAGLARVHIPIAPMLLAVQAIGAAAVIFPATRMAKRRLAHVVGDGWAFMAALSIFLVPTVSRCVDYDFHPSTIAITPLFWFIDSLDEGDWKKAWFWFLVALSFREDIGLQGAAVAFTFLVLPRAPGDRLHALLMVAVGLGWFFGYTLLLQPRWLPPIGSYALHFGRFSENAGGVGGVLSQAFADPGGLARYLVSGDRKLYLVWLLVTVAVLPLAAPRWLFGALPIIAINMLSDFPGVREVQAHYVTAAAPFLVAAAIEGAWRLAPYVGRIAPLALLLASAGAFTLRGASPASPEWRWAAYRDDDHARRARAVVRAAPPDAEIAAPSRLIAHLAERKVVRRVP
jgi:uncharacterized membrane protein